MAGHASGRPATRAAFTPLTFDVPPGEKRSYNMARAEGSLGGDPGSGCLWLRSPVGTRSPVRLMTDDVDLLVDFTADPFVLRSGERVVAVEGAALVLTGGVGTDEAPYAPGCPVSGTVFTGVLNAS